MLSLVGYGFLSIIIVLFLKPFLNIDRSIAAYCFPFGLVYIVLLASADYQMFDNSKIKNPNLINPGDTVNFKKISIKDYRNYNE